MAWFDTLIEACSPYLTTDCVQQTVGADWQWDYYVEVDGVAAAWTSGYTGLCKIKNKAGGDVIATPTVSFPADGQIRMSVANATTEVLDDGQRTWEVEVTRTSDGKKCKLIGGGDSRFVIKPEVAD